VGKLDSPFLGVTPHDISKVLFDNPLSARVLAVNKTPETIPWTVTFADGVTNIGTIETMHEACSHTQIKLGDNFFPDTLFRGGSKRNSWYAGKAFMQQL